VDGSGGPRILIADDEPYVVLAICDVLRDLGGEVLQANDGEQALHLARTKGPDLVLLDLKMPGLGGFEVAEALKADPRTADIPVMFFSAAGSTSDKVRGLELAEDYIAKPIDGEELKARVRKVLRRRGPFRADATSGKLGAHILPALLRRIEAERQSGRLLLAHGSERGEIHFDDGAIVRAVQGARLGDAAVYQLLTWHDGTFELAPAEPGWVGGEIASAPGDLLGEGLRRLEELATLQGRLRTAEGPLHVPPKTHEAIRGCMAPAVASLVSLLDGSRGLRDVLVQSPLDVWHTLKLLVALQTVGALTSGLSESERRSALRFKVAIPIQYQGLGLWQEAATFNLSAWGVFIRTAVPFDAGEQVLLRFALPERDAPLTVMGKVIWGNPDPSKWGGMGMGIQFVDLADADREAIEWHLAQRVAARLATGEEAGQKDGTL
jgi:uncharacterized protein (TIGR02266 family)